MTILQRLSSIKDSDIRRRIIKNAAGNLDSCVNDYSEYKLNTLISMLFSWRHSPEGVDYWETIFYSITPDGEIN